MRSPFHYEQTCVKNAHLNAPWHKLQSLGDTKMRLMMCVASVPSVVALLVTPIGKQPNPRRFVDGAQNIHSDEPWYAVNQMGSEQKRPLNFFGHAVGDGELAQCSEHGALLHNDEHRGINGWCATGRGWSSGLARETTQVRQLARSFNAQ